jgi:hypothetical protein
VQKTKRALLFGRHPQPVFPYGLQQLKRPLDVGANELSGAENGAVHMALRGKMHNCSGALLLQQAANQCAVHDVAANEAVAAVLLHRSQVLQVSGVGQLVQNGHRRPLLGQPLQHEIGTDETCASGHQYR